MQNHNVKLKTLRFLLVVLTFSFCLLNLPKEAEAATYYASPSGSGTTCSSVSPCFLASGLAKVIAGDTLLLKDGIYSGTFAINGAHGNATAPITIKAENKHRAIIRGAGSCDPWSNIGFDVYRNYLTIRDLRFQEQGRAVFLQPGTGNIKLFDNIFENFHAEAIIANTSHNNEIYSNVFANGDACAAGYDGVGVLIWDANFNNVHDNIFTGIGKEHDLFEGSRALSIAIYRNSNDNIIQGNIVVGGNVMLRIMDYLTSGSGARNMVRDNAFLFSWSGTSSDGCIDSYNQFVNNLIYGGYYNISSAKGNSGPSGYHRWDHNLFYMNEFSRVGFFHTAGGSPYCEGVKHHSTITNNIVYSSRIPTPWSMFSIQDQFGNPPSIQESRNNLFWAPGNESAWTSGYTYQTGDIHNPSQPPVFANASVGDFVLTAGSPGKNSASDGKDIGIEYNSSLKKNWVANAFALPTQQKSTSGTSASFAVKSDHEYDVWFYVPESNYCLLGTPGAPYNDGERFNVEGAVRMRDINSMVNEGYWSQPGGPQRWFTLGRHKASDGTLNISWTTSNCVSKVFVRELPTSDEAYSWITGTIITPSPLSGDINNDRIVNSLDWSLMSAKWLTADTSADLNKDGAVNSLDWSIMSSNWLKTQ